MRNNWRQAKQDLMAIAAVEDEMPAYCGKEDQLIMPHMGLGSSATQVPTEK